MADPTNNYVPTTADFKLTSDVANDNTIESALISTVGGGPYQDFDSARAACDTDLIDSSYGVQGTVPTSTNDFRGYPKPTVNMQYLVDSPLGGFPAEVVERLTATPVLNSPLGFNFTINITVEENENFDDQNSVITQISFTFNAGSTTPDSAVNATSLGGGKYQLTTLNPSSDTPIVYVVFYNGATSPNYFTGVETSGALQYISGATIYNFNIEDFDGLGCQGLGLGTYENVYSYVSDVDVDDTTRLFSDAGLSVPIPNGWYIFWQMGFEDLHYGYTTNGWVGSYVECTLGF